MLEQSFEIVSMIYAEPLQVSEMQSHKLQNAKYVVGVCSDKEIDISQITGSSALAKSENYLKLKNRILQLQDEEEVRNKHIAHLDKEIEFCRTEVTRLNSQMALFGVEITSIPSGFNTRFTSLKKFC